MKRILLVLVGMTVLYTSIVSQTKNESIDLLFKKYFEQEKFMGNVLVADNGKVVYKNCFGYADIEYNIPHSPDGVFKIASITKTFVGTITMQLVQNGKLKLDNTISDFLPYYRKDIGEKVTIHHLLTHSSGIPNYLGLPGFVPEAARNPLINIEDFIKEWCSRDFEYQPGERFSYNNSGYAILGAIIEKVTGMNFEQVLRDNILVPCGMNNTGMDSYPKILKNRVRGYTRYFDGTFENSPFWDISTAYTAGQMYSTLEDMLKYHEALMGEKLLKNEYKEMMFKTYYPAFGHYYGYGWMIRSLKGNSDKVFKVTAHEGGISGFNLYFARIPETNQVVVLLNNTGDAPLKEMADNIFCILNGVEFDMPKKSIAKAIYKELLSEGIEASLKLYDNLKISGMSEYNFEERELNSCGYQLLKVGKIKEAIEVFKKNVEVFPKSGNTYDSLAEGYLTNGDKANAIKYYKKSIELDSNNEAGKKILKRIQSEES